MTTSIWWIRRDLRLLDNVALSTALNNSDEIIPLYILDPKLLEATKSASKRQSFLFHGLKRLDEDLRKLGSSLILRSGDPRDVLMSLSNERSINQIFSEGDNSPYSLSRDSMIREILPLKIVGNSAIIPPGKILKSDDSPYIVFTPFSKIWKNYPLSRGIQPPPLKIFTPSDLDTDIIPSAPIKGVRLPYQPGEHEAQLRLHAFIGGSAPPIYDYADARNNLALDGTSGISPYLKFGMISAHQAAVAAIDMLEDAPSEKYQNGAEIWLNELIWRDFYMHILYHFPYVLNKNFRMQNIRWNNNLDHFEAWKYGQTGYPIVDAAMRQLLATGWMHNRARMIVASFLTKDLLIDWRWGERWFMQHLIDAEPASNNGGWQWTAGTGTDAAPFFRIFNPVTQGEKFDPGGIYIRKWLPELEKLPKEHIHKPWQMPSELQKKLGFHIGKDYPQPLVDHAWARKRALTAFAKTKE